MDFRYTLQKQAFTYKDTEEWDRQMRLLSLNPILYLEEYKTLPEDIYLWKQDEELHPAADGIIRLQIEGTPEKAHCPEKAYYPNNAYCIGIGTYKTSEDGEIYLCVLLNSESRTVDAYSFGVYRSPELVGKALENFFCLREGNTCEISLLSSRNAIYQSETYAGILAAYPVRARMTEKGSHGQAAVVSTYFSQLMRRRGKQIFSGWQDAIDWLTADILKYNLSRTSR